jgi:hypothetical protein
MRGLLVALPAGMALVMTLAGPAMAYVHWE